MPTRVLPFFGRATAEQAELIKTGKQLLDPGFLVKPEPVGEDTVGVALALEHPKYCYLYGYAYAANADSPQKFRNALAAVYGIEYSEHVTTPAQWLSRVLGKPVTEVEIEEDQ